MTIAELKNYKTYVVTSKNNNKYIYNQVSGKLETYEFVGADFRLTPDNGEISLDSRIDAKIGGQLVTFSGTELQGRIYDSVEAFEKGNLTPDIYAKTNLYDVLGYCVGDTYSEVLYAAIENRIVEIPIDRISMHLNADLRLSGLVVDGSVINKGLIYGRKEDLIKYHDYIVIDENGNETLVKCTASYFRLEPDQRAAVDAIGDAIRKALDLGVKFYQFDGGDGDIYSINTRHTKKLDPNRTIDCGIYNSYYDKGMDGLENCIDLDGYYTRECRLDFAEGVWDGNLLAQIDKE